MYTNTPDQHFVIGRAPGRDNVVVLGGFSGHGYKMASVVGDIAAELVVNGKSAFDLGMFGPGRFSPGSGS
jgi:sarcosine oxidase